MTTNRPLLRLLALLSVSAAFAIAGCGGLGVSGGPGPSPATSVTALHGVSGTLFGAQQPVVGASIQMYTMNPTTLRGAATALLPVGSTISDGTGHFNITAAYNCPAGDYAYMVATGGSAGAGTNTGLGLMAGLGPCNSINASTKVTLSELTTAATAYALAPYMKDFLHAGYNGGTTLGLTGIANAFAMLNSLANIANGTLPGATAPANAAMPTQQLTNVADVLAACVNSITASPVCTQLFGWALSGGTQPGNTIDAALNIANNPGQQVGNLFGLIPTQQPYPITATMAPTDFTATIKLTGGSLSAPYGVAIDANGNAWVTNETGTAVSEFSPIGAALAGSSGVTMNGAQGLSIDPSGNVWIANTGANNLIELSSAGALSRTVNSTFLNAPVDIAADARGNIWVANFLTVPSVNANYISEFTNSGVFQNGLTGGGSVSAPVALAVAPNGDVWASNATSSVLTSYSKNFVQNSPVAGYTDSALQGPAGIAFDASGNAWVAGQGGPELSGFTSAGTSVSTAPVYNVNGASLAQPTGVAVDGAGSIWVTNSVASGYLSKFTAGTGAPVANFQALGTGLNAPVQLAIDPSGNIWTANSGDNSVTIFVGLAAPSVTPLVARTQ